MDSPDREFVSKEIAILVRVGRAHEIHTALRIDSKRGIAFQAVSFRIVLLDEQPEVDRLEAYPTEQSNLMKKSKLCEVTDSR